MQKLMLARETALKWHEGQMYGDKQYIYHLDSVVAFLTEQMKGKTLDEDLLVIGMLHDIVEDTGYTLSECFDTFGHFVTRAVNRLTKLQGQAYDEYIKAVLVSDSATIVKRADTFCNLRESLLQQEMRRVKKYARQLELLS
jgi:(p)ppGpp synthase/HD superfamily hydrolase